jgi:hypothetical protein
MTQSAALDRVLTNQNILLIFAGVVLALFAIEWALRIVRFRKSGNCKADDGKLPFNGGTYAKQVDAVSKKIVKHDVEIAILGEAHKHLCENFNRFLVDNKEQHTQILDEIRRRTDNEHVTI